MMSLRLNSFDSCNECISEVSVVKRPRQSRLPSQILSGALFDNSRVLLPPIIHASITGRAQNSIFISALPCQAVQGLSREILTAQASSRQG